MIIFSVFGVIKKQVTLMPVKEKLGDCLSLSFLLFFFFFALHEPKIKLIIKC